jgi:energy-coupling factor transporter transmembrane protein EcfT
MDLARLLSIHPLVRAFSALLFSVAAFSTHRMLVLGAIYACLCVAIILARLARPHIRFIALVTAPLLIALMLVWGVIMGRSPVSGLSGYEYAVSTWARIVISGGAFQWLILPLANNPSRLRGFLASLGISGTLGTLIISPIIFLPEVRRRVNMIIDARKAQGHKVGGVTGLLALPTMLGPLVASLLDGAMARAELWEHRGLLSADKAMARTFDYSIGQSAVVLMVALGAMTLAFQRWI